MQLSFRTKYLSIDGFPTTELPTFTVVIGINGAGKTHLLRAIKTGAIQNSLTPPPQSRSPAMLIHSQNGIILLSKDGVPEFENDSQAIVRSSQSTISHYTSAINQSRNSPFKPFEIVRGQMLQSVTGKLVKVLGDGANVISGKDPWRLGIDNLTDVLSTAGHSVPEELAELFDEARLDIFDQGRFPDPDKGHFVSEVNRAARILEKDPLLVTEYDTASLPHWGGTSQFAADMAMVFGRYRDARLKNQLQSLKDEEESTSLAYSKEEFERYHGVPPWDLLNDLLRSLELPVRVIRPNLHSFDDVHLLLVNAKSGDPISVEAMSSGERVLFKFALSLFDYNDNLIGVARPKVLLLDEIDASLHPEMVVKLMNRIQDGLVTRFGMSCIMTTHSPTTAALAPEDSLFEMLGDGNGLQKISKKEALRKLTFGVPSLAIEYESRRQVIVESNTDAELFSKIYSVIKSKIYLDSDLDFISCGVRNKDGHEKNGGCGVVTDLVAKLTDAGANSIFGLVDWDGEANPTDRVKVLAHNVRDGIENVLLDPLLVAALLIKVRRVPAGLLDGVTFVSMASASVEELQAIVDVVQNAVLEGDQHPDLIAVDYIGGFQLKVAERYLRMDDHKLESAIARAFPYFVRFEKNRGMATRDIVNDVLTEHTNFVPGDIIRAFRDISEATA
ncbi:ATP-binding protein [Sphingobium yanoikuyae]|uniref:ATP-binding protein n=1 Tax=Sphingobium yanoikuyae TaxID=13690 RepID=UPI00242F2B9C|nr:ATP-binding protein [Sphingobium yanoikuyae]